MTVNRYKRFTHKQFAYLLRFTCIQNKIGYVSEVSEEWDTWEHIYKISTKNKAVDIIVFSSVDMRTGSTRESGNDAVRIVLKWETKNGIVYKRVAKHKRIETLFDNMKVTLEKAKEEAFNLKFNEFKKELVKI